MRNRKPYAPNGGAPIPDFEPVPRRYRHDGWTAERQRAFIDALAETGSVSHAASAINMSPEGAYYLRRQPGAEGFRAAWAAALDFGVQRLTDIAMQRAIEGVPVPIMYHGEQVGERRHYNDRLLMFILRHHLPERYASLKALRPGTKAAETLIREATEAAEANMTQVTDKIEDAIAGDAALENAWDELHWLLVNRRIIPQCEGKTCICQNALEELPAGWAERFQKLDERKRADLDKYKQSP